MDTDILDAGIGGFDVRLDMQGSLYVCLCDQRDGESTILPEGPLADVEMCVTHEGAVRLASLVERGFSVLLQVKNESGDIMPLVKSRITR